MTTTIEVHGAPIHVVDRGNGGAVIIQGTSAVRLSAAEVGALVTALRPSITNTNEPRILRLTALAEIPH
ncbi:hypothetical protein BN1232_02233 [Mycobacterium lentiflavum]|uniref:Dihydrodiol dehydrogenase n=1 Tax=Mycobacterium lentiflavum TaxID=141349 RepID=A0A0E4GXX6_MYCLN|nr:hypothetical protein [Mycobacterium lentiflavum]CQD11859.1 hypothetical protein BN1232_02233 [Mycobacterium lentiflavum]